ncbi:PQQ-dependent sugar dehydrogenase [Verrucomicrobiota bacterium sgz303538]
MRVSPRIARVMFVVSVLPMLAGCYVLRPSSGGGQTSFRGPRVINPSDIALTPGYQIELVASGFTFPTGVAFDGAGRPHVVEAGYSYGEVWTTPRLLRVESDGHTTVVARGGRNGPWNGVTHARGNFYVAEGGELEGGRILRISPSGGISTLVSGLPSIGDHHTNGPAVGPDGWIYFGQGTATNSGVVGKDNAEFGWVKRNPQFHDIPGQDIVLTGQNFETRDQGQRVVTGAFVPYGTPTQPGQIIRGQVPCNGAIMRIPPGGGRPQLVAWGFRNPFGLAFAPDGQLYATENGYDDRGSRPIFGAGDPLWRVERGRWYGWPDFSANMPLAQNHFSPPGKARPQFLLAQHPGAPPRPAAVLDVHASADGFDFSRSSAFGYPGQAFVALFGDQSPKVGKVTNAVGFKVVRVDPRTGVIEDFAINRGYINAPASAQRSGGLERPIAARFDPSGRALYVVDFGVLLMDNKGSHPKPGTGALWRITRVGS